MIMNGGDSPTPWKSDHGHVTAADDSYVGYLEMLDTEDARIIRAVNSHKALVTALERCADWLDWLDHPKMPKSSIHKRHITMARKALALAKED